MPIILLIISFVNILRVYLTEINVIIVNYCHALRVYSDGYIDLIRIFKNYFERYGIFC